MARYSPVIEPVSVLESLSNSLSKKTYHQRSKDETVFSVVKRTMGDEVRSIGVKAQNNEMRMKIISYNAARIASRPIPYSEGFYRASDTVQIRFERSI